MHYKLYEFYLIDELKNQNKGKFVIMYAIIDEFVQNNQIDIWRICSPTSKWCAFSKNLFFFLDLLIKGCVFSYYKQCSTIILKRKNFTFLLWWSSFFISCNLERSHQMQSGKTLFNSLLFTKDEKYVNQRNNT